jgi:hypothetical protein
MASDLVQKQLKSISNESICSHLLFQSNDVTTRLSRYYESRELNLDRKPNQTYIDFDIASNINDCKLNSCSEISWDEKEKDNVCTLKVQSKYQVKYDSPKLTNDILDYKFKNDLDEKLKLRKLIYFYLILSLTLCGITLCLNLLQSIP